MPNRCKIGNWIKCNKSNFTNIKRENNENKYAWRAWGCAHTGVFRKKMINKNNILLLMMLIAILIMGIGYSAIGSVTGEIKGNVIAKVQEGVFITNVEYVSSVDGNITNSQINNFIGTVMQSTVEIFKTNAKSEITYKVTVHNNSANTFPFNGVVYSDEFYDNSDIVFQINNGFQIGQKIEPNETKEIFITL